jgi:hypothetical protein
MEYKNKSKEQAIITKLLTLRRFSTFNNRKETIAQKKALPMYKYLSAIKKAIITGLKVGRIEREIISMQPAISRFFR